MAGEFDLNVKKGRARFVRNCPYVPPVREDGGLGNGRYQEKRIRNFRCPGGESHVCGGCPSRIRPEKEERPSQRFFRPARRSPGK